MASDSNIKRNVSLRDIASELGISHATVSLALRDHERISGVTKERVKRKAEEMGYVPDPTLSALSHYRKTSKKKPRTAALAWINPPEETEVQADLVEFQLYRKGALNSARQLGFELEEFTCEKQDLQSLLAALRHRQIQGLVVAPITRHVALVNWNEFPWQEFSAIRFGANEIGPPIQYVASAQVNNTIKAFRALQAKGYRRIGYVGQRLGRHMYIAGYLGCQMELPDSEKVPPLLLDYDVLAPTIQGVERWMREHRSDAILTNIPALPAMLAELGYSVPGDVSLATMSIHDTPIDAGIDQNPEEIGGTAVRSLVGQVNEQHFGIPAVCSSILIEGRWVDGSMLPRRSKE